MLLTKLPEAVPKSIVTLVLPVMAARDEELAS